MEEVVTKCPEISLSLLQDVSLFQPLVSLLVLPPWSCYSSLNVSTKSGISYVQFTPLHIVFH
jgi:hypothetical protein